MLAGSRVLGGGQEREEQLWQLFFEDPSVWLDNRTIKTSPRFPDFKHATTGAGLWINSRACPKWVAPKLSSIQTLTVGSTVQKKAGANKEALTSYLKLKDEGVWPSIGAVLSALKACTAAGDLQSGRKIHRDAVDTGDIFNIYVANTVVNMYAKCGSMAAARQVFEEMKHRDVVSWTALIQGYANLGEGELALSFYERLKQQQHGWESNRVTVLAALKACGSLAEKEDGTLVKGKHVKVKCLEKIESIHKEAGKSGDELDLFVANSLVDVYSKCGNMGDARKVFDGMQKHSIVSWNCLIQGYAEAGEGNIALELYTRMQEKGFAPDVVTFIGALKACACLAEREQGKVVDGKMVKVSSLESARAIHAQADKSGGEISMNLTFQNTLVDVYAKCGCLEEARCVFDKMNQRTVVSWSVMILGYAENGEGERALELYVRMKSEGCVANLVPVLAAVKACASLAEAAEDDKHGDLIPQYLDRGRAVHGDAARCGVELNQVVANTLIDMYSKCWSMDDAYRIFQMMRRHDIVSWNCIILGYAKNGGGELALKLYSSMQGEGCLPDRITFLGALKACAMLAETEEPKLHQGSLSALEKGRSIHLEAEKSLQTLDLALLNTLVDMYAKCGDMVEARRLFDGMQGQRSGISWNCIILGYAQSGEADAALKLFSSMQAEKCTPNAVTFVGVFKACGALGALETTKRFQAQARSAGLDTDIIVVNSLVDCYGKCGSMSEAEKVFASACRKTVVTWGSLMSGYTSRGHWQRVFDLFESMKKQRVKPDRVTFLCLLTACSHAGLVEKGKEYLQEMVGKYGLVPGSQHYACMVDLLGRMNQLDEAVAMVKRMPCEASPVIWMVLLAAAEKWTNVEVGRLAFNSLRQLDPRNGSAYVLMSNIYASAGLVEEFASFQALWKDNGSVDKN